MLKMVWLWLGFFLVACAGSVEPLPEEAAPVVQEEAKPVDVCANPPPHDCCRATTPECNRCRATYEGYIRSCPDAIDKRVRVPVENKMEWSGNIGAPSMDTDTDSEKNRDINEGSGVHFRGDTELSKKSFLTCDELEEALCCRGSSPDCMACRSRAQSVISQCRMSGKGGIQILHSPVGQPGNMDADSNTVPQRNVPPAPSLQ